MFAVYFHNAFELFFFLHSENVSCGAMHSICVRCSHSIDSNETIAKQVVKLAFWFFSERHQNENEQMCVAAIPYEFCHDLLNCWLCKRSNPGSGGESKWVLTHINSDFCSDIVIEYFEVISDSIYATQKYLGHVQNTNNNNLLPFISSPKIFYFRVKSYKSFHEIISHVIWYFVYQPKIFIDVLVFGLDNAWTMEIRLLFYCLTGNVFWSRIPGNRSWHFRWLWIPLDCIPFLQRQKAILLSWSLISLF